jgi:hypothetical protein
MPQNQSEVTTETMLHESVNALIRSGSTKLNKDLFTVLNEIGFEPLLDYIEQTNTVYYYLIKQLLADHTPEDFLKVLLGLNENQLNTQDH